MYVPMGIKLREFGRKSSRRGTLVGALFVNLERWGAEAGHPLGVPLRMLRW